MFAGLLFASVRAQFRMSRRDIGDLFMLISHPVYALVFMAIFVHVGREDLASYALVAPMLMGVVGTAAFVASELVMRERRDQTLEVSVICPAPFPASSFPESWSLPRSRWPGSSKAGSSSGSALELTSQSIIRARSQRQSCLLRSRPQDRVDRRGVVLLRRGGQDVSELDNVSAALFSGVLVPVTAFPDWLEPVSRIVFLYWAADLLRASMQPEIPQGAYQALAVLAGLGIGSTVLGAALLSRMIGYLRREGRLGIF